MIGVVSQGWDVLAAWTAWIIVIREIISVIIPMGVALMSALWIIVVAVAVMVVGVARGFGGV